ncbi:GPI transamidase component PIG-S-related [Striga hermonthica]|uniref:GPI transamidase component PIG-S-related n=1 Tax=Striga hermonthica TaxID=68872 RepID=A0A9N7R7N5_STRHE|nr:GPI transamidase component PIG-S-related [Striga hermonthica]
MDAADTPTSSAMAEISGAPPSSASEIQSSQPEFDPETMRKTKPGFKRLVLTFTVFLSFLIGLPFFLKSIEIYRSPLPFREINRLSASVELNPLHFPCKFRAVLFHGGGASYTANELSVLIQSHMRKLAAKDSASCGTCDCNSTVSVALESVSDCSRSDSEFDWKCGSLNELNQYWNSREYDDELFDGHLKSLLDDNGNPSNGEVYTVIVVRREEDENVTAVVGKYRHAWVVGRVSEEEAAMKVAEIFVKAFMNGGKEEGSISGEFMPVGADGRIVLSFNLLNADPRDWIYGWDFQELENDLLAPITEALKPLADIRVESQVLYHTPKASFSYWDDKLGSFIFTAKDLPFFVNSNEWHLDASVAAGGRSKILHFVLYVPSASECPLQLRLPNGDISPTHGFISPMWGSVVVWNPACFNDSKMETNVRHKISPEDMKKIFEVFIGQLRQLFGLKSKGLFADASGTLRLLTSDRGFTEWELDVLSRQHTCFNLLQCSTTLGSLSRLVKSLPRMIIKDEIGKQQVRYSLEAAKMALSNVSDGVYDSSAVSSRQARSFAEDAFYHPSMMSVSYYSFEHCFAVYSPFFLPVSLHVLLAALREWKRYKQEKRKYDAWKDKKL